VIVNVSAPEECSYSSLKLGSYSCILGKGGGYYSFTFTFTFTFTFEFLPILSMLKKEKPRRDLHLCGASA